MKGLKNAIFKIRPADLITISFIIFLFIIVIINKEKLPKFNYLIFLYSSLLFVQVILIKIKKENKFLKIIYNLIFPTICVLLIFDSLEWVVHYINPDDIDSKLLTLDYLIFKNHPTLILEKIINPILTDILQIAYSTYYFIPIVFGILLLRNGQKNEFDRSLFLVLLCFYLSYLGYILFPALGPRFTINHLQTVELKGFLIAEDIQNILNRLEGIKRDAFPSGHTGVMLTILYLSFKFHRRFFWFALPIIIALIFSTVYCRYHYVVDVIAGILLTIMTVILGEPYYKLWLKHKESSS